MTFDEYQEQAMRSQRKNQDEVFHLLNAGLGAAGEAGEIADIVKKHLTHGHPLDIDKLLEEVGDELWYLAEICKAVGASLDDAARRNIAKLKLRYPDGFSTERSLNRLDLQEAA